MTLELPPENFERQVQDCLTHLYDFTELQTNPLAAEIAHELTGLQRVQTVRRVLIELVEQLKARETGGIPSRQERIYSVLSMRYVEGLPVEEVLQQLALSERQFYREQHRAIQAVSQLLWDRLKSGKPHDNVISVKSEMQRLSRQSSYETADIEELLIGAITANTSLAEHREITMHYRSAQAPSDLTTHHAVLRQMVIWMLSQIIMHVAPSNDIALSTTTVDHIPAINFEISGSGTDVSTLHDRLTNNPTVAEFLATLQGTTMFMEVDGGYLVQLQLQRPRQVILVIDDNPDVVALLERYVTGTPYEIVSAYEADEGFRLAQTLEPSWIVLDIMLPHTDGWKMLQSLKSHPQTQAIPVLVCSVLENPDLALSLGADAYLRKPPDRISFLEAVGQWKASEH